MNTLGSFLIVVGVVFVVFKEMIGGHIKTVEGTGIILVVIVFLIAAGKSIIAKIVALVKQVPFNK